MNQQALNKPEENTLQGGVISDRPVGRVRAAERETKEQRQSNGLLAEQKLNTDQKLDNNTQAERTLLNYCKCRFVKCLQYRVQIASKLLLSDLIWIKSVSTFSVFILFSQSLVS
ncbi:hypothetical protein ILYODFUR_038657 [Ilyodon furcidens]|uniref:Uncharacterized protein n=1 Tax=Ilyodon furcidens TaxID=33524 RepID=A0ABV0UCN5_9TELE